MLFLHRMNNRRRIILNAGMILGLMTVILIFVAGVRPTAAADNKTVTFSLRYLAECGYKETEVSAQSTQKGLYLLLPSSADYSDITLKGPPNAELRGSVQHVHLQLDEDGWGNDLNLTELFGPMTSGNAYSLKISYKNGNVKEQKTVLLLRSGSLASLHITLDTSISDINSSTNKSIFGAGYLVKLDALGRITAEAGVEKMDGRGNASWEKSGDKKSYSIKLMSSEELIRGAGEAKKWNLISNNVTGQDNTGLYNTVILNMFTEMGGSSALKVENVDLYVNNKCRGTYLLAEKPEIHSERVDIRESQYEHKDRDHVTRVDGKTTGKGKDEIIDAGIQAYQYASNSRLKPGGEGGFLLELDFRYSASTCWFITRQGMQLAIVEPEYASYEQVRQIALFVQKMEDAMYHDSGYNREGHHYSEYIDLKSLALRYALDCFGADRDAFLASEYFYTEPMENGELMPLQAGPAWDFDYCDPAMRALIHNGAGIQTDNTESWMYRLLTKGDFMLELRHACVDVMMPLWHELNKGRMDEYIDELSDSHVINDLLWQGQYETKAAAYKRALKERYELWETTIWSDRNILGLEIIQDGDTLHANASGKAGGYQWYRVDPENGGKLIEINGATKKAFTPKEDGRYVVSAKGGSVALNPIYKNSAVYQKNGRYLPVALENITLYSAGYEYGAK